MPTESKRSLWVERMADHAASGLGRKQWCEQNDIPLHQFAYWRRELFASRSGAKSATGAPDGAGVEWCGLQVMPSAAATLSVYVGPARIAVDPGFDADHLRAVVEALGPVAGQPGRREAAC